MRKLAIVALALAALLAGCRPGSKAKARVMVRSAQLAAEFSTSSVRAEHDVQYRDDGFAIEIPEGFRYAKMHPPTMLMAARDGANTINVLRHVTSTANPEGFVRSMLATMKTLNDSYEFEPLVSDATSMRTRYRVRHAGVAQRGLMVLLPRDGAIWQLMVTGPADGGDAALDRIAGTWTVN